MTIYIYIQMFQLHFFAIQRSFHCQSAVPGPRSPNPGDQIGNGCEGASSPGVMDGKGNTTIIYYAVFLQAWMVKSICVVGIVFCLWFHGECIFKTQQEAFEPIAWYSQSTQKMVIKHAGV